MTYSRLARLGLTLAAAASLGVGAAHASNHGESQNWSKADSGYHRDDGKSVDHSNKQSSYGQRGADYDSKSDDKSDYKKDYGQKNDQKFDNKPKYDDKKDYRPAKPVYNYQPKQHDNKDDYQKSDRYQKDDHKNYDRKDHGDKKDYDRQDHKKSDHKKSDNKKYDRSDDKDDHHKNFRKDKDDDDRDHHEKHYRHDKKDYDDDDDRYDRDHKRPKKYHGGSYHPVKYIKYLDCSKYRDRGYDRHDWDEWWKKYQVKCYYPAHKIKHVNHYPKHYRPIHHRVYSSDCDFCKHKSYHKVKHYDDDCDRPTYHNSRHHKAYRPVHHKKYAKDYDFKDNDHKRHNYGGHKKHFKHPANHVSLKRHHGFKVVNRNVVSVSNSNRQYARSGDAKVYGNTYGGYARSGDASNYSSIKTNINI